MAALWEDILAALEGHAGNAALVGTRIYPLRFPPDTAFPCQVYNTISNPIEQAVDGTIRGETEWVQIDHFARHYLETRQMCQAAREALLGMVAQHVDLHEVRLWNEIDSGDSDAGLYRRIQEWMFTYS